MTAIVGILCRDGVVIGADSSASFSQGQLRTIEQPYEKIEIIGEHVIVSGTGQIGLAQRFCEQIKKTWEDKGFQKSALDVARHLAKVTTQDFANTSAKQNSYGALVAFPSGHKAHLCEFSILDFQPEFKTDRLWYCSMGSAQPITDTFLAFIREIFWDKELPNLQDGIFAATWTLDHAIRINPGGVNSPIRIAVLENTKKGGLGARLLTDDELGEHHQNIIEAKECLRNYKLKQLPMEPVYVPEIPKA